MSEAESTGGGPARLVLEDAPEIARWRAQVQAWLAEHAPADWRERMTGASNEQYAEFQRWWLKELHGGGLAVPHWPKRWGGGELSLPERVVVAEEIARAGAPTPDLYDVSLNLTAPTLLATGTEEQCERHLRAIIEDGEIWCQGFSEPNAGSDLAAVQTSAKRRGDVYVVNGQKTWASYGLDAEFCLLLARSDREAPKRRGMTMLIVDMRSPGVEVRAIKQNTGNDDFCEIFFDDVEVPVEQRVGAEGEGWSVARVTLSSERGETGLLDVERLRTSIRNLAGQIAGGETTYPAQDAFVRQRLAALHGEVEILRLLGHRMIEDMERGGPGTESSLIKLAYSEALQRACDFGSQIHGMDDQLAREHMAVGYEETGHWLMDYVGSWSQTISRGANEIQRNIIAERVLGLPREPQVEVRA